MGVRKASRLSGRQERVALRDGGGTFGVRLVVGLRRPLQPHAEQRERLTGTVGPAATERHEPHVLVESHGLRVLLVHRELAHAPGARRVAQQRRADADAGAARVGIHKQH